ncbi:MAM and LDL-receptor class A domain-containing protein 1-like [Exaiptasia diaphana]|uniref:MAM domain-containing protein n=1 Tax=Exaiptasia diaphana TaxID=2652724 RepID=A0A913YJU3_EXADI|nr:MAM and LDL-receptor class A domain-containing protein 1-like [Exaiptasia diaphana]
MCTTISVPCSFDDGFCGFTHDVRSQRKWFIGQSATPTQNTGPSIDHTTLTHKGSYIFIEASEKKLGDKKARLTSCWFNANITQCLQFWYHMYGIRIGSLRILKKTNSSEDTIWDQSENKGDLWRFGQTTLEGNDGQNYQFVIEGVTRQGNEMEKGDIAVDDVTLHDGVCKTVSSLLFAIEMSFNS